MSSFTGAVAPQTQTEVPVDCPAARVSRLEAAANRVMVHLFLSRAAKVLMSSPASWRAAQTLPELNLLKSLHGSGQTVIRSDVSLTFQRIVSI